MPAAPRSLSRRRRELRGRLQLGLQDANHNFGRATGFAFGRYPTRLNAELCTLLEGFSISHVLDVGGHEGGFGRKLRKHTRFEGHITSFEPTPRSYAALAARAAEDGRWSTLSFALGSEPGTVAFNTYGGDGQMNSVRPLGTAVATYAPKLGPSAPSMPVEVRRLDDVWPDLQQDPARTFLKTDTQGYDLEVIRGAGQLMELFPAVLMEVAVQPLYEGAPTLRVVAAAMDDLGFEMTGAFPIHRYGRGLRVIEFDCTFVNQRCF